MRNHFLPICLAWSVDGSLDQPKVAAGIVDSDVEEVAVVVGIVFDVLLARFYHLPVGFGLISRDIAGLARGVASRNEKQISLASRSEYFNAETRIFLLINQVVGTRSANGVAIEAILPLRGVLHRIKNCFVVIRPRNGAGLLDAI